MSRPVDDRDTVAAIAAAVRNGRRQAGEILAEHVARHEAAHAAINALVQPRHAEAATEAAALGREPTGLLAGVPVSVKECFGVRGQRTTLGIPARSEAIDEADAEIVVRLRAAGGLVVGKANVPQAMYLHETDNPVWGRTSHPFRADRSPGGSSGGDAALVAAGVVPLGVGNDLAGSLRQPAHACGIATVMPRSHVLGEVGGFDSLPHLRIVRPRAGFLARCIADLTIALEAVVPGGNLAAPRIRRVGWWDSSGPIPPSPAIVRGVAEAVGRLGEAGIETVALDGSLAAEAAWLQLAIISANGGRDTRRLFGGTQPIPPVARLLRLAGLPRSIRPLVATVARLGGRGIEARGLLATGPRDERAMLDLLAARETLAVRFAALLAGCDAVVCPVSALPALRHGTGSRLLLAAAPCLAANLFGLAAGAVPVTLVRPDEEQGRPFALDPVLRAAAATDRGSAGLPVGVQVIAPPGGDEATVLEVMRLIERP